MHSLKLICVTSTSFSGPNALVNTACTLLTGKNKCPHGILDGYKAELPMLHQ
ncbi:hypothetical protein LEMLEM_LOCUS13103 [Lemmus lemmus]